MTTASWNTPIEHSSDATFRLWGAEFSAKLAAIGLVQTSDTGQINWTTVTRPGTSTAAGYEIWRFNDTLQGTAPIFLKVEYGTNNTATGPGMWLTVGTGSNGAGTITGQATSRTQTTPPGGLISVATNRQSYACAVDGFMFIATKMNSFASGSGAAGFAICRTCDSTGTPTTTGFVVYFSRNAASAATFLIPQAVRTASPAETFATNNSGYICIIPHAITSSVDGGDTQAFVHWAPMRKVIPVVGACTMLDTEAAFGVSFTTTLVGTTPRTYLSVGSCIGNPSPIASPVHSLCLIYE